MKIMHILDNFNSFFEKQIQGKCKFTSKTTGQTVVATLIFRYKVNRSLSVCYLSFVSSTKSMW